MIDAEDEMTRKIPVPHPQSIECWNKQKAIFFILKGIKVPALSQSRCQYAYASEELIGAPGVQWSTVKKKRWYLNTFTDILRIDTTRTVKAQKLSTHQTQCRVTWYTITSLTFTLTVILE